MSFSGHPTADVASCVERGYGLGDPTGVFVLVYHSAHTADLASCRQDLVHQLYWSPDGVVTATHRSTTYFTGPHEAVWAPRAVEHEVRGSGDAPLYRVCVRRAPPELEAASCGILELGCGATEHLALLGSGATGEEAALRARDALLSGVRIAPMWREHPTGSSSGHAQTVARALSRDPGDATTLGEWAERLHVSSKTLQRDFGREFGTSFSAWRTEFRMRAARAMLATRPVHRVARDVGYSSASAFVVAYSARYGHTPGTTRALGVRRQARPETAATP